MTGLMVIWGRPARSRRGQTLGASGWVMVACAAVLVLWLAWVWGVDQRQLMAAVHLRGLVSP